MARANRSPSPSRSRSRSPPTKGSGRGKKSPPRSAPTPRPSGKRAATSKRVSSAEPQQRAAARSTESAAPLAGASQAVAAAPSAALAAPAAAAAVPAAAPRSVSVGAAPAAASSCVPRPAVLLLSLLSVFGVVCVAAQDGPLLPGRRVAPLLKASEAEQGARGAVRSTPEPPAAPPVTWREAAAPATLLAAAPLLARAAALLRAPRALQWAACLLLLASSSALAILRPFAPAAVRAPPVRPDVCAAAIERRLGPDNEAAAAALRRWAAQWERGARGDDAGPAAKLLLFSESHGGLATQVVDALAASGAVAAADVFRLSADGAARCAAGAADAEACDVERFLAARSAAGRATLVVVEAAEGIATDGAFDRAVAPLERLIEPTLNQEVGTAHGPVRASLHAVLLVAARLSRERCAALRTTAAAGEGRLQAALDTELEELWPRERFSPGVNAAKRAFVNRLAHARTVLCEAA